APVAIAWQLKFPGATAAILEAFRPGSLRQGKDWFDGSGVAFDRIARIDEACDLLARRVAAVQQSAGVDSSSTIVVGFSQGATMALALARRRPTQATIVVSYAGQLARPIAPHERVE